MVFLPADAMGEEPVILRHLRPVVGGIEILAEKKHYQIGAIKFSVPSKQAHPVATYGLIFDFGFSLGLISDTKYFPELEQLYKASRCNHHQCGFLRGKARCGPLKPSRCPKDYPKHKTQNRHFNPFRNDYA